MADTQTTTDIYIADLITTPGYSDHAVIIHRGPRDPDNRGAIDWNRAEVVARTPINPDLADNYPVVLGWLNDLGFQPLRQASTVWEGFEDVAHGCMVEVEPR